MKNPTYVVVNSIEKETEKAILVNANFQTWLPKSQIEYGTFGGTVVVKMPAWLWYQHKYNFTIRTTRENIFESTGEIF